MGYPSCSTELCRIPANRNDPHGYYAEVGVPPWADADDIRRAVRRLYRRLHPDTGDRPDPARLQRVKLIADVLLDPAERARYDRTPPGKRLLDAVYRSELSVMDLSGVDQEKVEGMLRTAPPQPRGRWYDYLAVDRRAGDMLLAQRWYSALVGVAPVVGYRRRIKVLLHDGPPTFHHDTAVLAIPRSWRPSRALAFALFTVEVGVSLAPFVGGGP